MSHLFLISLYDTESLNSDFIDTFKKIADAIFFITELKYLICEHTEFKHFIISKSFLKS